MDFCSLFELSFMIFTCAFIWGLFHHKLLESEENSYYFSGDQRCGSISYKRQQSNKTVNPFLSNFDILEDLKLQEQSWSGLLIGKHPNDQTIEALTLELQLIRCNTVAIQVYPNSSKPQLTNNYRYPTTNPSEFKANLNINTKRELEVYIRNVTDEKLVRKLRVIGLIWHQLLFIESGFNIESLKTDTGEWYIWSTKQSHNVFQDYKGTNKDSFAEYSNGIAVIPIADYQQNCSNIRNSFGLAIILDENGESHGIVHILGSFLNKPIQYEIHFHVSKGSCLTLDVYGDQLENLGLVLDFICFYGLFGYPNGFFIDKDKKYNLDEDDSLEKKISKKGKVSRIAFIKIILQDLQTTE